MWTESDGRRQKVECRSGDNLESGIRAKRLGCRALRQLRRRCARPPGEGEIRQIRESDEDTTVRPLPKPLSIGWKGWPQAGRGPTSWAWLPLSPIQSPVDGFRGQRSSPKQGGGGPPPKRERLGNQFKFLTVRNLISSTAARTYVDVSANSLQCVNRGHGPTSAPASRHSMERVAAGRESHGSAGASPYRLGAAPTTPHWFSGWPVSLPIQISHCEKFEEGSSEVLGAQSWGLAEHARRTGQSRAWVSLISANHAKCTK